MNPDKAELGPIVEYLGISEYKLGVSRAANISQSSPLVARSFDRSVSESLEVSDMKPSAKGWQVSSSDTNLGYRVNEIPSPIVGNPPLIANASVEEIGEDPPYAQLIFQALMSVPDRQMILQDIYVWFEKNTMKPQRCPNGKQGWRNSIRHNLSMNQAFQKIDPEPPSSKEDGKKCFIWRLSEEAQRSGRVMSTTRYRKNASKKRRPSENALRSRLCINDRVSKQGSGEEKDRSKVSASSRQAIEDILNDSVANNRHQMVGNRTSSTQKEASHQPDNIYFSLDGRSAECSFSYNAFDGTLTPASTMSIGGDTNISDPVVTSTPYSPNIKLEPIDTPDLEREFGSSHSDSLFGGMGSYKLQQQDISGQISEQSDKLMVKYLADELASCSTMAPNFVIQPATCNLAELKLSNGEHFSFINNYGTSSDPYSRLF